MKLMQLIIYFNVVCQVHFFEKKGFYKMWTFDCSNLQYRGKIVYQTMHCWKKVSKAMRQKLVEWMIKNSNVCESPISCDTLLITDAKSGVKRRVT